MPPLIILPGALGAFEGSNAAAARLSESRPVSTIKYGPDDHLETLFRRISDAAAGVTVDLLGQSYGGWIAQCFARHRPEQVRRLVLSHTFVLRPEEAKYFRLAKRMLDTLPRPLVWFLLLTRVKTALAPIRVARPEVYRKQLRSLREDLMSGRLIEMFSAQQTCIHEGLQPDTAVLPPISPDKLVLIIDSDNDPLVGFRSRASLRASFPDARSHTFQRTGHVSAIVATDDYVDLIRRFLDE